MLSEEMASPTRLKLPSCGLRRVTEGLYDSQTDLERFLQAFARLSTSYGLQKCRRRATSGVVSWNSGLGVYVR